MDKSFKNCKWSKVTRKGKNVVGWFCNNKRWHLADHDIGTGLCPCLEWTNIIVGGKSPVREWTQPGLFE